MNRALVGVAVVIVIALSVIAIRAATDDDTAEVDAGDDRVLTDPVEDGGDGAGAQSLEDPTGDCTGCDRADLRAIDVIPTGVTVTFGSDPVLGTIVRVWPGRPPIAPIELLLTDSGWESSLSTVTAAGAGKRLVVDAGHLLAPVAVTTEAPGVDGGDRAPDRGVAVAEAGATVARTTSGDVAEEVETEIAAAQLRVGSLRGPAKELALMLIPRQASTMTTLYDYVEMPNPVPSRRLSLTTDQPLLRQDLFDTATDGTEIPLRGLIVLADEKLFCDVGSGGGYDCAPSNTVLTPIDSVLDMIERSDQVIVVDAPDRNVAGVTASCVVVTATAGDLGPPLGETCAGPDGTVVYLSSDRTQAAITLLEQSADVDPTRFEGE